MFVLFCFLVLIVIAATKLYHIYDTAWYRRSLIIKRRTIILTYGVSLTTDSTRISDMSLLFSNFLKTTFVNAWNIPNLKSMAL